MCGRGKAWQVPPVWGKLSVNQITMLRCTRLFASSVFPNLPRSPKFHIAPSHIGSKYTFYKIRRNLGSSFTITSAAEVKVKLVSSYYQTHGTTYVPISFLTNKATDYLCIYNEPGNNLTPRPRSIKKQFNPII